MRMQSEIDMLKERKVNVCIVSFAANSKKKEERRGRRRRRCESRNSELR